jgi:hypothetical protein
MAITLVSLFVLGMGHFNLMFFKKFSMVLKKAQIWTKIGTPYDSQLTKWEFNLGIF